MEENENVVNIDIWLEAHNRDLQKRIGELTLEIALLTSERTALMHRLGLE